MTKMSKLRLYRGVSAKEFEILSRRKFSGSRKVWEAILLLRARGEFSYPKLLDREIRELAEIARLERQHFTDNKKIATSYARKSKGQLIEITVPIQDVVKNFRLEFQNFGRRKAKFELVYVVHFDALARNRKAWKLRGKNIK